MSFALGRRLLLALLIPRSPRALVAGVSVVDLSEHKHTDTLFDRIGEALHALENRHPWRWRQVQRAFRHILIIPGGGQAYAMDTRCCLFDVAALEQSSPARIAAFLVHESIHARLHRFGVRLTRERADRIEHLCVRHELDVLESFPSTEKEAERLRESAKKGWWHPTQMRERRRDQLRGMRWPHWIIALHARLWP